MFASTGDVSAVTAIERRVEDLAELRAHLEAEWPADGSVDVAVRVRTLDPMKTNRLELRVTDEERDLDASAAAAVGETLSEFFRQAARERAVQIIDKQRTISLGEADARRFLEALDAPDPDTITRLGDLWNRPVEPT